MSNMKIGIPPFGDYTQIIQEFASYLGWELVMPAVTDRTIELGNKHLASELMCLPAKSTLGSMIEACELGATDLIMFDACGLCRQKAYWILQQRAVRRLGYNATVHPVRLGLMTPKDICAVDPSVSYWKAWQAFIKLVRWIFKQEKEIVSVPTDGNQVRIGIVGEIYTVLEPAVNKNLIKKLEKLGASVHNFLTLSYFISKKFHLKGWLNSKDRELMKVAEKRSHKYFPKDIGGHGNEAITFAIYYALKGFNGVIHLLPFPCMPEATISPVLDDISRDYGIPVMRFIFDTHAAEAGLDTRLEAFVDILQRRKKRKEKRW